MTVPAGCPEAESADVAFVGTVLAKDFRTVRYEIDQLRAGSAARWAVDGVIDVRYGTDAQYIESNIRGNSRSASDNA